MTQGDSIALFGTTVATVALAIAPIGMLFNYDKAKHKSKHIFYLLLVGLISATTIPFAVLFIYNVLEAKIQNPEQTGKPHSETPTPSPQPSETPTPSPQPSETVTPPTGTLTPIHPSDEALRNAAFYTLREDARLWLGRNSPRYQNFLPALKAIEAYDDLTGEDLEARNTLLAAASILKFQKDGLNFQTKTTLPIKIIEPGTDDVAGTVATWLRKALKSENFNIVESYTDAALIVDVHDARANEPMPYQNDLYRATTSFNVRATWVGGDTFFDKPVSESATSSGDNFSITRAGGKEAQIKSLNSAVTKAASLFLKRAEHP